ncbi:unnamed protein product [Caenorhabditis brenneri]
MPGINQVQVYAHFESEGIGSINVNLGPDDCAWYTVPMEFAASLEQIFAQVRFGQMKISRRKPELENLGNSPRSKKAEDQARAARIDSKRRGPVRSVFKCQICFKKYDFDKKNMKPKFLANCGHICCETCAKEMTIGMRCPYCREETPLVDCPVLYQLKRTGDEDSDTESEGEQEGEGFNSR